MANHRRATEVLVGFYRIATGKPSLTWDQAVDEALCFGWIDGVRRRLDDARYVIRFTPRRPGSVWSAKNTARAEELIAAGRMTAAGRDAFSGRNAAKSALHSYQRQTASLDVPAVRAFKRDAAAWAYYSAQPPSYRRLTAYWVMSARKPETRATRLVELMQHSRRGERIPLLASRRTRATGASPARTPTSRVVFRK